MLVLDWLFDLKKLGSILEFAIMSAANTAPSALAVNVDLTTDFWNSTTVELNEHRLKKNIPPLPVITEKIQVVRGGGIETVAYLALQVRKSQDKRVIMRAIASATSVLLNDAANFLGSPEKPAILTGLDVAQQDGVPADTLLKTNFEDAEDVTIGELLSLMEADTDEIGAYFGVLYLAGNKKVTRENASAFNEKRQKAATASIIGDPVIFVADSPFLDSTVLTRVYAAFLSYQPWRSNMTYRVADLHLEASLTGAPLAFVNMFLLLVDNGMNALKIIKESVLKHPWIRTEFPELKPELQAANEAQTIIRQAPGKHRSFLKAVHGSNFVPVNYSQIDNLTGVCKEVLKRSTPSYANYAGGKVTEKQLTTINTHLGNTAALVNTVSSE